MYTKHLILTVGLPRSGKTTWALSTTFPIVNRDAIRLALHGEQYLAAAEGMVSVLEMNMVKALFLAGHDNVIVDATHTTRKRRDYWKSDEWDTTLRVINTPKDVCIARAQATDKVNLIPVIERMAKAWDIDSTYRGKRWMI